MEAILRTFLHAVCSKLSKGFDEIFCLLTNILTGTLAN
jgi:hypothetical protein